MTLLGIDVGTTGCKAALFSPEGTLLQSAYREYDIQRPQPGWAELDAEAVWGLVKATIREVTAQPSRAHADHAAIRALAVSSIAEAVVPVTMERRILGPSLLNFDVRGEEYLDDLERALTNARLYSINGNALGNHYSLTKLMWLKQHRPEIYDRADCLLNWSGFICFMLGAEPAVDFSLANRSLLFDIDRADWSAELVALAGLDLDKLPPTVPSGMPIGTVAPHVAADLGLPPGVVIVSGAHDQCVTAVGCGVIDPGRAVYGLGTYSCITTVFTERPAAELMIARGLNTEHHAVAGHFVSFLYNHGGSIVKWYRDTFAAEDHRQAVAAGRSVYPQLFAEVPVGPSPVIVLPHFSVTGPPDFISDSCGVIVGPRLDTRRGDILKGIIEGVSYYLKELVDSLPATGITITDYRVAGGGSQSDVWVQTCADIMNIPISRPVITEAGTLGAALIAGVGSGVFASYREGTDAMVTLERRFEPDALLHERYRVRYAQYKQVWPLMRGYLRDLTSP